ncbi:hypothetical protein EWM64_g3055, partial [Hericium alpestre]
QEGGMLMDLHAAPTKAGNKRARNAQEDESDLPQTKRPYVSSSSMPSSTFGATAHAMTPAATTSQATVATGVMASATTPLTEPTSATSDAHTATALPSPPPATTSTITSTPTTAFQMPPFILSIAMPTAELTASTLFGTAFGVEPGVSMTAGTSSAGSGQLPTDFDFDFSEFNFDPVFTSEQPLIGEGLDSLFEFMNSGSESTNSFTFSGFGA